jgi:cytochrome c oxidase subunit IV
MATPTTHDQDQDHAEVSQQDHVEHPSDGDYIKIALILGVLTAIEVALYYTDFGVNLTNGILVLLAAGKFIIVAAYFMHLKFDSRILRRLFITGFFLAVFCYAVVLLTFGVF